MAAAKLFKREQRDVALAMSAALLLTIIVLGIVAMVDQRSASMPFDARLQFAIRIDLFVVAWLAAAIGNVARLRFFSERDIGGSIVDGGSGKVRVAVAILQNTFEQVGLAIAAHLIVAATFSRTNALLVALVGLFAIGRTMFWAGYKNGVRGRAFGFALTFYPSILVLAVSMSAILLQWVNP